MHNNFHQHGTTGGVGGVWRGAQAKDSSHSLHARFGAAFCSILVKVHVLYSNNAVSKVGTNMLNSHAIPFLLLTLLKLTH